IYILLSVGSPAKPGTRKRGLRSAESQLLGSGGGGGFGSVFSASADAGGGLGVAGDCCRNVRTAAPTGALSRGRISVVIGGRGSSVARNDGPPFVGAAYGPTTSGSGLY